jgi:cytochrome P450
VSSNPAFSTAYGVTVNDSIPLDDGAEIELGVMPRRAELRARLNQRFGPGSEPIFVTDAPRHTVLRRLVSYAFTPRFVASLTDGIRKHARDALDAVAQNNEINLVEALSIPVPMHTIGDMFGVPIDDRTAFTRWADSIVAASDLLGTAPDSPEVAKLNEQLLELATYFVTALADREQGNRDDLLTAIIQADVDGERLDLMNQLTMVVTLILGANETTRNLISGGAVLLAEHPEQRELLIKNPELMNAAVEECLRCVTPVHASCRTATESVMIRDKKIERGDYVALLYGAANGDEDIWESPEEFNISRPVSQNHVAFGFGAHVCLGANLARNQARIVFEELLTRYPHYELAGEVLRVPSTSSNGIESVPIRLSAGAQ